MKFSFVAAMFPLFPGTWVVTVASVPWEKAPVPVESMTAVYGLGSVNSVFLKARYTPSKKEARRTQHRQW